MEKTKGDSETKQQLKKLKRNSDANEVTEEYGYKKAEHFKENLWERKMFQNII